MKLLNLLPKYSIFLVPNNMKVAKVIPIYKKGPVSLLPCFSKILERLVFNRCLDFIESHDILNKKQFGFRPNHSTCMAISQLVDKVNSSVERNETQLEYFSTYQRLLIRLTTKFSFTN